MTETITADRPTPTDPDTVVDHLEALRAHRTVLRSRHTHSLARLMDQRRDLRGVLPMADLVDDAVRWTA